MRVYADSSVILRLITGESGADQAAGEYRRMGRPSLFYLPLHALELENGIRQRAFSKPLGSNLNIQQSAAQSTLPPGKDAARQQGPRL